MKPYFAVKTTDLSIDALANLNWQKLSENLNTELDKALMSESAKKVHIF